MREIYFTRHGQTTGNVANKICGITDVELTPQGREQARDLAKEIQEKGIKIDEIISSPLVRASETAKIVSEITRVPYTVNNALKEQNFGIYEGVEIGGAEFKTIKRDFVYGYEGGETVLQVAQRVYNLLDELKKDPKERTFMLIAHNGLSRVVRSYFMDIPNKIFDSYHIKNCEILKYKFK